MRIILLFIAIFYSSFCASKTDPVNWKFFSNKTGDKTYEVHFIAIIKVPWHVYAQDTDEGVAFPTSFSFNKNPLIKIDEKIREIGEMKIKKEDEISLKYYEKKVDFVQIVKLKTNAKTNLTGKVEYMACENGRCLPPAECRFSISVGGK